MASGLRSRDRLVGEAVWACENWRSPPGAAHDRVLGRWPLPSGPAGEVNSRAQNEADRVERMRMGTEGTERKRVESETGHKNTDCRVPSNLSVLEKRVTSLSGSLFLSLAVNSNPYVSYISTNSMVCFCIVQRRKSTLYRSASCAASRPRPARRQPPASRRAAPLRPSPRSSTRTAAPFGSS